MLAKCTCGTCKFANSRDVACLASEVPKYLEEAEMLLKEYNEENETNLTWDDLSDDQGYGDTKDCPLYSEYMWSPDY